MYLALFALLLLNNFADAVHKTGLIVGNESDVGLLVRAVEEHEHFYLTSVGIGHSRKVDAPCLN